MSDPQTQLAAIFPGATGVRYQAKVTNPDSYVYQYFDANSRRVIGFQLVNGVPVAFMAVGRFNLAAAQDEAAKAVWQVFLQRDVGDNGADKLTFINEITGDETSVSVQGERYTLAGKQVIYFDPTVNRVMVAAPDGTVRDHPFIQMGGDARRVDWLVAPDSGIRMPQAATATRKPVALRSSGRVSTCGVMLLPPVP